MHIEESYDYIVIGAGTAGCVLANRLSARKDISLLLIEAGGPDNWMWIHIPVGYLYCIGNPRTDWCYKTETERGLNGRSILYARGKVLGGCSSINAMLYLRGQSRDYDEWAQLTGDTSWAWQNVLPLFKRSQDSWRGSTEFHGAGGEWRVEQQRLSWKILDVFRDAAAEFGIPKTDDFNRGDNEGCSKFEVNQRTGVRWNATKAFLKPAMSRPNLTVVTNSQVKKLRMENRKCVGVEFTRNGVTCCARANRETILSAGSINSPQILQLSGIGAGDRLRDQGIPVICDLPGVGENLQDHLQLRMAFKVKNVNTLNTMVQSFWGKAKIGLEYAFFRTGPLTMAPSQLGAFTRSDPAQITPNIEFHIQPLSLEKFGEPLHEFDAFTASVCNLRPTSRGSVRIKSADPCVHPAISLNYLSTELDRKIAVDSLRLVRRIVLGTQAMKNYSPEEFMPGAHYESDVELVEAAGNVGTTIFHPVGTCKMGQVNDPTSVVSSTLKVRGIESLRVIDASIMPTITSGNTNSPTIMIAEKGAQMILDDVKA